MADTQQQQQGTPLGEIKKGKFAADTKTSDLKKKSPQVQKPVAKKTEDASKVETVQKDGENVVESTDDASQEVETAQKDTTEEVRILSLSI